MSTINLDNVYILNYATAVTEDEANGPLGNNFDVYYDDLYCNEETYEKAEQKLLKSAIHQSLAKASITINDIGYAIGGDLMNQLMTTNYVLRDFHIPTIGIYGACSNSALSISMASVITSLTKEKTLASTASHYACAEKQFRYPNEYGIQKRATTTTTVSGAGALILTTKKHSIKISSITIGRIIDANQNDANDMGSPMSVAAFDTIVTHLKNTDTVAHDYDLIITGDLSKLGHSILKDMMNENGYCTDNLEDCGLIIYEGLNDKFLGGSGCACSMLVLLSDIFPKLEQGIYRKVLFVATGALLSPIAIQQKDTIPCIAHGICFERGNV